MNIRNEFLNFHVPSIGEEEIKEVVDCLRSGWLTTGPRTKRFEEETCKNRGTPMQYCVSSFLIFLARGGPARPRLASPELAMARAGYTDGTDFFKLHY